MNPKIYCSSKKKKTRSLGTSTNYSAKQDNVSKIIFELSLLDMYIELRSIEYVGVYFFYISNILPLQQFSLKHLSTNQAQSNRIRTDNEWDLI